MDSREGAQIQGMDPAWPASSALPPHVRPRLGSARLRGHWPSQGLVRALGVGEPMPRGLVRKPGGSGDLFIAWFPQPVQARLAGGLAEVPADSALAWRPGMAQMYGIADAAWLHSWVHLRGVAALALADAAALPMGRPIALPSAGAIGALAPWDALLIELHAEAARTPPDEAVLAALASVLVRRLARLAPEPQDPLEEVRRAIAARPESPPPLPQLAALAGLSPQRLCTAFAARYGAPPHRWALGLRLEQAARLLRAGQAPSDVAAACGWSDRRQFARRFRARFGRPPSAW